MRRVFFLRTLSAQGNIFALLDGNGDVVVKYSYDAWGKCKVLNASGVEITSTSNIGLRNPFRYRGYYFDTNTGLYYLKSRFYDPETGRFLNADTIDYLEPDTINGLNLYAYCRNNPVMCSDESGHLPKWLAWTLSSAAVLTGIVLCATGVGGILGGILIGAGAGSLVGGYVNEASGGSFTAGYVGGALSGALCGAGAGLGGLALVAATEATGVAAIGYLSMSVGISFAGGFAGNIAGTLATHHLDPIRSVADINWKETFKSSAITGLLNVYAGIGSGGATILGNAGKAFTELSSKTAYQLLSGILAGTTEAIFDLCSYLISQLLLLF